MKNEKDLYRLLKLVSKITSFVIKNPEHEQMKEDVVNELFMKIYDTEFFKSHVNLNFKINYVHESVCKFVRTETWFHFQNQDEIWIENQKQNYKGMCTSMPGRCRGSPAAVSGHPQIFS